MALAATLVWVADLGHAAVRRLDLFCIGIVIDLHVKAHLVVALGSSAAAMGAVMSQHLAAWPVRHPAGGTGTWAHL